MTVKITIEYANVESAIVALGKLSVAAGTTMVEGRPRKGRSDKGQSRKGTDPAPASEPKAGASAGADGPAAAGNGSTATTDASKVAEKATTSTSTTAAAPGVAPVTSGAATSTTAPASSIVTEAEAQKALEKLFESFPDSATGIVEAKKVLAKFGVSRVRDLKEEQRADFVKDATAALPKAQA